MEMIDWLYPLLAVSVFCQILARTVARFADAGRTHYEPEPRIPSALEDWDADFERATGIKP